MDLLLRLHDEHSSPLWLTILHETRAGESTSAGLYLQGSCDIEIMGPHCSPLCRPRLADKPDHCTLLHSLHKVDTNILSRWMVAHHETSDIGLIKIPEEQTPPVTLCLAARGEDDCHFNLSECHHRWLWCHWIAVWAARWSAFLSEKDCSLIESLSMQYPTRQLSRDDLFRFNSSSHPQVTHVALRFLQTLELV